MQRGKASYEFPAASEEDSRRNPRVRTRILLPRPGAPARGHSRLNEPRTDVPRRDIADPQMSNEATDGLAPSGFAIFRAKLERILALFRQRAKKDPRRDITVSDSRGAPEAWCSRTGTLQPQIPTRLVTLLSNTPRTNWCYSGSPHPILHRGPLRRLPWTTCYILTRSNT